MPHSYVSALYHCVFSTKGRRRTITDDLQKRLWPYLGGIARENNMRALAIGGVKDHVHLSLSIPSTISIAKAMQLIKGGSSKWVHDTFPEYRDFEWQEGYGAFTIGVSQVPDTKVYIANQREHHRSKSYQEELIAFLEKHAVEYDPRCVWGRIQASLRDTRLTGRFMSPAMNRWAIVKGPSGTSRLFVKLNRRSRHGQTDRL